MVDRFDTAILLFVNQFAQRSWAFDYSVVTLTYNDLVKGGLLTTALWWTWFAQEPKEQTHRRHVVLLTLIAAFGALSIARMLALLLPFRLRPSQVPDLGFVLPHTMKPTYLHGWSAFPSDHAALFFALATGLLLVSRVLGAVAFGYVLVIICFPRIYLGLHYPTDIVAGAMIGITATLVARRLSVASSLSHRLLAWSERSPSAFYALLFFVTLNVATIFQQARRLGNFALDILSIIGRALARALS